MPPINVIRAELPAKRGTKYVRKELQEKNIAVTIELIASSFSERLNIINQLTPILYTTDEQYLALRDGRKYKATLSDSTDLENLVYDGQATLEFIATDPIAVGSEITETIINSTTYTNNGTYESKGVLTVTITADVSYLEVILLATGESIYIEDTLLIGDVIEIDFENETVKKNDVLIMDKLHLISEFFAIPTGNYELSISSGDATLVYNERWL